MPRELPVTPTVIAEVRNIEYTEVSANVTVAATATSGTATITLPATSVRLHSIRVYAPAGYTGKYTVEVSDSAGNVIYRYTDHTGTLVDMVNLVVTDDNATLNVTITLPAAPGADQTFTVRVGLSYIA